MFDLIIENGTVIDGSGAPRFRADVGVSADRIEAVGDLSSVNAARRIDAEGLIAAPGFIDVHTHSDGWMLKRTHRPSKTAQGFTTELLALDGVGYAPLDEHTARQWMFYLRALDGLRMDEYRGWRSLAEFMEIIDGANVQNAATHVPYANVRSLACGFRRCRVDDFQMRSIQAEIRRGMEAGAVGLSTGLDYIVQCFSTTDELVEACRALAPYDGLYVTHVRYKKGLLAALQEAVEIARRAGVRLHVSHLKAPSGERAEEVLEFLDRACRDVDVSFDVYPYQPGSTLLSYLLPNEVWEDGPLAAPARLADPAVRARFAEGLRAYRLDLDRVRIAWIPGAAAELARVWPNSGEFGYGRTPIGMSLAEYVARAARPPEEALVDLLLEERLAVLCVMDEGDDKLVEPFLKHPLAMIGSDGIDAEGGRVHPRHYGTTGRLLGPYVRDRRLFSLEEAVHKLSGRPAERFSLAGRGLVREGYAADLVVFDPHRIADCATWDDPHRLTVGVEYVLVGGESVIERGQPAAFEKAPLPGRFLRAKKDEG